MITEKNASTVNGPFKVLRGLSTETKPTDVANGSEFTEIDTGKKCLFNEETKLWPEQPGGGTSDYADLDNKPSINGVTLTGDKSLADLGSRFIITVTEDGGTWTADKTTEEIAAAYNAGKTLFANVKNAPFGDGETSDVLCNLIYKHGNNYGFEGIYAFFGITDYIVRVDTLIQGWTPTVSIKLCNNVVDLDSTTSLLAFCLQEFMTFLTAAVQNGGAFTDYGNTTTDSFVVAEMERLRYTISIATYTDIPLLIKLNDVKIPCTLIKGASDDHYAAQFLLQGMDDSSGTTITYLSVFTLGFTLQNGNISSVYVTAAGFAKM